MKKLALVILLSFLCQNAQAQTSDWKAQPNSNSQQIPSQTPIAPPDESQELINLEGVFASNIVSLGPLNAYSQFISQIGTLVDAGGTSPEGTNGVVSRFGKFPTGIMLERLPESALASGGAGSSWGAYQVKKGASVLSSGRYVTVWRKEFGTWKIVTEIAAGKENPPPPLPPKPEKIQTGKSDTKNPPVINPKILYDALGRPIKP